MPNPEELAPSGGADDGGAGSDPTPNGSTPDPIEEAARAKGWKADHEGETYLTAKEFLAREPLFDKIKHQSKELREMKKTIDSMATHFRAATEAAVQQKIAEFKSDRRKAIEDGDVELVEQLDVAIQEQQQVKAHVPDTPSVAPEISEWTEKNKWFNSDTEMRDFAIAYNEAYLKRNPDDLAKSLQETEKAVKRAFPDKFENPKREQPQAVEGGVSAQSQGRKYSTDRLSPEQKLAYNQYVKVHKVLEHDEYFKQLEAIGELK